MRDRTIKIDIFDKNIDRCLQNLMLDWRNLSNRKTDGTPNVRGKNIGCIGKINWVNKLLKFKYFEAPMFKLITTGWLWEVIGLENVKYACCNKNY